MTKEISIIDKDNRVKLIENNGKIPVKDVIITKIISESERTLQDVLTSTFIEPEEKAIIVAFSCGTKIKDVDGIVAHNTLEMLWDRMYFESGSVLEQDDIILMRNIFVEDVNKMFSQLTFEEIKIALQAGIDEKFGKLWGLNNRTFRMWLNGYKNQLKTEATRKMMTILKPKEKEYSQQQIQAMMLEWVNKICLAYHEYCENGIFRYDDFGNVLYNKLEKHNIINFTKELKKQLFEEAKAQYITEHAPSEGANLKQRKDFNSLIKELKNGDKTQTAIVTGMAKKLAIGYVFQDFKEKNINIERLLKDLLEKEKGDVDK